MNPSYVSRSRLVLVLCSFFLNVALSQNENPALPILPANPEASKIDGDALLAPDHLPDIRITLPQADWDTLRHQSRDMGAIFSGASLERPFTYCRADISIDGVMVHSVGVRKKGFIGSLDNECPSLKIKFDEYVQQDPIEGLNRLTLNNNKQDESQVSQFLTYRIFRDAGVHAPRSNLARVTVNNVYLGIYSNVESVKKPFLRRSFGDPSGNLYEGTLTDFYPKTVEKFEAKTNKKENDRSRIAQLSDLLAADGKLQIDDVGQIVDIDNFLRFWAIEGAVRFWDGYASNQNNYFFYENPKDQRGYFIPWGADGSFSKDGGPFARFGDGGGRTSLFAKSMLANRLYRTEGVPERYKSVMLRLLDEVWNEDELLEEIDRIETLIESHLHDRQKNTAQALRDVRDFISKRRAVIEKELSDWPAEVPGEPRKPMYAVTVGDMKGSFTTNWYDDTPDDPATAGTAQLKLTLNGKAISFEEAGASAQPFEFPRFGPPGGRRSGPARDTQPPVSIMFTGTNETNNQAITATLFVDRLEFEKTDGTWVEVRGMFTEGSNRSFGFFRGGKSLNGRLRLSDSGTNKGDAVVGEVELNIVEVRGGLFGRRPPPSLDRSPPVPSFQRTLDIDGDGTLSSSEIENATDSLKKLDVDGDGKLTTSELLAPQT